MSKGFSLVELSIVLVILGLLVGGILAGKSLIRASELRKVHTDVQRYRTATFAFRDKYFMLPGDISNATSFWGKDAAKCNGASGSAATPGTCNGNADNLVGLVGGSASNTGENTRFWQHLSLAGLIEGDYTGLTNAAEPWISGGTNMPAILNAPIGITPYSWGLTYNLLEIGSPQIVAGVYTNTNALHGPAFKPEDAWNIDSKMDDGLPSSGKLTAAGTGVTCVSSAQYALTNTDVTCLLFYRAFD